MFSLFSYFFWPLTLKYKLNFQITTSPYKYFLSLHNLYKIIISMGGALYGYDRIPRDKFLDLINRFIPELKKALGDIEFSVIPYYSNKEDFGDLDIVVKSNTGAVRVAIIKHFNFAPENRKLDYRGLNRSNEYITNGNSFSFVYENFQIDLICTTLDYETSISYYSYNEIGNILGRIFNKLGLKFGHKGLLYPVKDAGERIREEIVIEKDIMKTFEFMGLDGNKWKHGFDDLEDIFKWVSECKFFDPSIFISDVNKYESNKNRKSFSKFIDWVKESNPIERYNFALYYSRNSLNHRDKYIPMIDEFFGSNISERKALLIQKVAKESITKEKFNGKIVMEITKLSGRELGMFIVFFKKSLIRMLSMEFEEYVLSKSADDIKNNIRTIYEDYCRIFRLKC